MDILLQSLLNIGKRVVIGEGPTNAKLVFVGEALGEDEERLGRLFAGVAGWMLDQCCRAIGIERREVYITNVVPIRPRDNKLENLKELGLTWRDFIPSLKSRLVAIKPNCIVALGATALRALCDLDDITNWRGSILQSSDLGCKVVPTFHPSYVNRLGDKLGKEEIETKGSAGVVYDYGSARVCLCLDLKRAKEESKSDIYNPDTIDFVVCDTIPAVSNALAQLSLAPEVAFDIETRGHNVVSIAFASDSQFGHVIPLDPLWLGASGPETFNLLGKFFASHNGLIAQNGIFDITMLLQHFPVKRLHFDTMVAHHTVYPELPHALDFLTSVYTRLPYYKYMRVSGDREQFFKYNAMDAVGTFQVKEKLEEELVEYSLRDFFYGFVMPLWHCTFRMGLKGILVDNKARMELDAELEKEAEKLQNTFNTRIHQELNVRSHTQMKKYLYETLKLPKQYDRKTGNLTTDEKALEKLAKKNPEVREILVIRKPLNLRSKLTKAKLDEDSRARTQYSQSVTDTGRLSSRKTLWRTGLDLQNIHREPSKRKMFVADPGFILTSYDLSQSEARLVIWFARDEEGKVFLRSGGDIHAFGAQIVLDALDLKMSVTTILNIGPFKGKTIRDGTKPVVHGLNYLLGPDHLCELVLENLGFSITRTQGKFVRERYYKKRFRIAAWHEEIREIMNTTRIIITPFGRRRNFFGRNGEDLLRKMVAHGPQSTSVDCLDSAMVRIDLRLPEQAYHLVQAHDEGVIQHLPEQTTEIYSIIREELSLPIIIHNDPLVIPVEIKTGPNWGELKEVKL